MSAARNLAGLGNQNTFAVESVANEVGIASTAPSSTLDVRGEVKVGTNIQLGSAGVVTATSYTGSFPIVDASSLAVSGISTLVRLAVTDEVVTGIITALGLSGNLTGAAATISGALNVDGTTDSTSVTTGALIVDGGVGIAKNVYIGAGLSVAGTLTYEDVTNVDSVGLITAKSGVNVSGGQLQVGVAYSVGAAGVATAAGFVGGTIAGSTGTFTGDVDIADKIVHTGDTNTAIRFPSADTISLETGGTERARVTSDGEFLVGTTTDNGFKFKVSDGGASEFAFSPNDSGVNSLVNYDRVGAAYTNFKLTALQQTFFTGVSPSERLRITSAGTIGIGTVTPQQMLDVRGSAVIGIDQRSGNPGTTVGILTVRGHHVNSDSDYAQLYLSNSLSSGSASASIRAGRSGDNYGTTLSFYNNPTGGVAETERMRITAGGVVKVAGITSTASLTVGPGIIQEKFYNQGSALTGTYNHDLNSDGMVLYAYANASASFVLNVRGDASTTLNSLMHIGQTSVFTAYTGSNNTSYYMTDFQIDGASQTEKWNGGTAPTAGTGSGVDVYTFNILKTADATFVVYATFSNFA